MKRGKKKINDERFVKGAAVTLYAVVKQNYGKTERPETSELTTAAWDDLARSEQFPLKDKRTFQRYLDFGHRIYWYKEADVDLLGAPAAE